MVEQLICNQQVAGSKPVIDSIRGISSVGRAVVLQTTGHQFESDMFHQVSVAEVVDARDLKSLGYISMTVRVRPLTPIFLGYRLNGRTRDFDSRNIGSTPFSPAIKIKNNA